jgi:copper chaperone CopZ
MPPRQLQPLEHSELVPESPRPWPVAVLLVRGLHSARCALRVRNALLSVPGVAWVEVVLDPGFVRVAYDPARVDPETLPAVLSGREPHYSARVLLLIWPNLAEKPQPEVNPALPSDSAAPASCCSSGPTLRRSRNRKSTQRYPATLRRLRPQIRVALDLQST